MNPKEKKPLLLLLKLILLMGLLKVTFFFFNSGMAGGWQIHGIKEGLTVMYWSIFYDTAVVIFINLPFFLLLWLLPKKAYEKTWVSALISIVFGVMNSFALLLNIIDIFYYRFHQQRADADLFFVLRNPATAQWKTLMLAIVVLAVFILLSSLLAQSFRRVIARRQSLGAPVKTIAGIVFAAILFSSAGTNKLLPSYPLTKVKTVQLPLAQNSLHSFVYSWYRRNDMILPQRQYMPDSVRLQIFPIEKQNTVLRPAKNIVLFIMESVPFDFFDSAHQYKVRMPFLDSIVRQSQFFSQAYSYSYSSNKGITAILAGMPTITDIPVYHSPFVQLPHTALGSLLADKGYESAFFIGDRYDDFGFAKCCSWLGIQQYFSMDQIPGHDTMAMHTMGLHDEYVLHFMQQKIARLQQPFFAVQYNISTHFPNDLPPGYHTQFAQNSTGPMRSMEYYDSCLSVFFKAAVHEPWFANSVFIFCADHWVEPGDNNAAIHPVNSFHIPLFIYDPQQPVGKWNSSLVSQLDIANTVLAYAGYNKPFMSYGENLLESSAKEKRIVITRINAALYQAIDKKYVLGFDAMAGSVKYAYDLQADPLLQKNIATDSAANLQYLQKYMEAFLQTASHVQRP